MSRGDTAIMLALFSIQFLLPAVVTRAALALVFLALAIDVLVHERRHLPALAAALAPRLPPPRGYRATTRRSAASRSRP
jgi:hypothetical protein